MNTYFSVSSPNVGDKIMVDRGIYKHFGVYIGAQCGYGSAVVHNDKIVGSVVMCSLAEFSGGLPVRVQERAPGSYAGRQVIVQRALQLLGSKYDLVNFNCEHMANLAQRGVAESQQIQAAFTLVILFFGLIFLSRKG